MSWQMFEFGHAQVGDGDEVACCAEASCGALGLLEQAVHGFDKGVRSVVDHSPHDGLGALGDRAGHLLERFESAAPGPAQPERDANPDTFLTGQVIEAKPASRIVATYDINGWH